MFSNDEGITIGLRRYRELFREGMIPFDLEDRAVLSATPGDLATIIHVTYSIRGQRDPFYLFKASVDRATGDVTVLIAADWKELLNLELAESNCVD
jgi:hypothetical protein